jgi:hypothetical protein
MGHDPLIAAPLSTPAPEALPPGVEMPAPTLEQRQVADQIHSDNKEADTVMGLLGLQAGVLLLHDLAKEHLARPDEEEEEKKKHTGVPDPEGA